MAPESWKSVSSQNVSVHSVLGIGTGILKVCEYSECVADRSKGLYTVPECQIRL